MPEKIYLKPREGVNVRDPVTLEHLPREGRAVTDAPYWRRRLRDRDVEKMSGEEIKAPEKKQKEEADKAKADQEAAAKAKDAQAETGKKKTGNEEDDKTSGDK